MLTALLISLALPVVIGFLYYYLAVRPAAAFPRQPAATIRVPMAALTCTP